MAYDPERSILDQGVAMAWNNCYEQPADASADSDAAIHMRMHKLMETEPGVFKALCATADIDDERYAADLHENEQLAEEAGQEE